jgi:phosphatidylethanolamine-binding protein (PEBP) family uncharacterized protein
MLAPEKATPRHARRPIRSVSGVALSLVLTLAITGCGGSTQTTRAKAPGVKLHTSSGSALSTTIALSSPVLPDTGLLPTRYTCDGASTPPPLAWSGIPPKTAELALFVVTGEVLTGKLEVSHIDWGVTGLSSTLRALAGRRLPAGAIVGRNDEGHETYRVCPPKGSKSGFAVLLYALPHRLSVKRGFNARVLRRRIADLASAGGLLILHYERQVQSRPT